MPHIRKYLTSKNIAILMFVIYFIIGMMIFRDYGISTDEDIERTTSLINYTYVMERLMASSENDEVRNVLSSTTYLMDWHDRYYGVALQMLTVFVEHWRGFTMSYREIFLMRHAFTFINFFIAAIFFFLILRRRFGDSFIPVVGALFFILYPRFFGESFFNIKDILFFSWCVIASYFVLRWLEDDRKEKFIFPAAITLAVATNTRILGIAILLLACGFAFLQGAFAPGTIKHNLKKSFHLILITFAAFVVITPFTWANPIKNTIDIFFHFLRFQPWNWTHFYMGEMITREVPWHYIPVWMGITVPILYILLFFAGFFAIAYVGAKNGATYIISKFSSAMGLPRENLQSLPEANRLHLYDLFFFAMFACTLLGFILLRINMYEGWRHAYVIFLPFLYVAAYGLYKLFKLYNRGGKITRNSFIGVVSAYMLYLLVWMIINHPYQYVYFNLIGRQFAEENFTLDYWYVSKMDLARYAVNSSDEPIVRLAGGHRFTYMLTEEERSRVVTVGTETADFYLRGSRMYYEWRMRGVPPGFVEAKVIRVDGMRIATLYERVLPFTVDLDSSIWDKIIGFGSNVNENFHYLSDGNFNNRWATQRPQSPGDYLMFEFSEVLRFNYVYLNQGRSNNDFPRDLVIYTSMDGNTWESAPIQASAAERHFIFESEEFYFLRLEIAGDSPINWWSIFDMGFGYATH